MLRRQAPEAFTNPDQEIICYFNGGTRGPRAAKALLERGYTNVSVLDGGLRRYMEMFEGQ